MSKPWTSLEKTLGGSIVILGAGFIVAISIQPPSPPAAPVAVSAPAPVDPLRQQAETWNAKADQLQRQRADEISREGGDLMLGYIRGQRQRVVDRCIELAEDTIAGCMARGDRR